MSSATHNARFLSRSLAAVWHPCTQMKHHEQLPLIPIARGEGAWLVDMDGRRYLDGISSWWVNLFGHADPRIGDALKAQLDAADLAYTVEEFPGSRPPPASPPWRPASPAPIRTS